MPAKATFNGEVLAEADTYETVEGNIYFPPSSLNSSFFSDTSTTTSCPWKGLAHYKSITVNDKELKDAAWYYPEPKAAAANIKDHVAFYKNKVTITTS